MKWAYNIKPKMRAAMLLAIVLVVVLAKNLLDSNNVNRLGESFSSVYEDRLLVESYIYQLSGHLYEKKTMVDNSYHTGNNSILKDRLRSNNTAIATLLQEYARTELTKEEVRSFDAFKQDMKQIQLLETQYLGKTGRQQEQQHTKSLIDAHYAIANKHLNQLSQIQVAEGKRLSEQSKQIIAGSAILTQFEFILIIGIGAMIQMLVFASKSNLPKVPQNPMLN